MQLKHSRILLTGATGGLGQALAHALAAQGANLLLTGRDATRLNTCAAALQGKTAVIHTLCADLTRPEDVARVAEAARVFGVNVLINNAGINAFNLYEDEDWQTIEQVMTTNLIAPMQLTHALLPWLKNNSAPHNPAAAVVFIGSTFGSLPFPAFAAYSSAKAGLRGFSQALRRELTQTSAMARPVAVIYIAPRTIATALNSTAVNALNQAMGNVADSPEHVADQIVAALLRDRSELHLGFPERFFAWLNGCAPALIDLALRRQLTTIKHHAQKVIS